MPADDELDSLDRWLGQQVRPLPPPPGTFELISKRAHRRRIRRAAVSVVSAAAVLAAIGVAVPVGMSLHLTTSSASNGVAASGSSTGQTAGATHSTLGTANRETSPSGSRAAASASGSSTPGVTTPGYLPPNFQPYSVTWDSLSTGWIMGPAGTPGRCGAQQNSTICTSIARTDDGGLTWHGLPAPPVGGPEAATGVTELRFLNASYGWAFGPELWATDDGGEHWHQVNTGGSSVTDLETVNGRAYALFGNCSPRGSGATGDTIANCASYTLETTTMGSDNWTPVAGVPASLSPTASPSQTAGQSASALLQLVGGANAAGYLVAPDGTLYSGPLDGGAWQRVAQLPCNPGQAASDGLPSDVLLAPAGTTSSGATRLAMVCVGPGAGDATVYLSNDNGASWVKQSNVGAAGVAHVGVPQSLTALTDGTLILGTTASTSASAGIYLLPLGASNWQAAALSNPTDGRDGFTYVGMTSTLQGVALSGNPKLHEIWMTVDGGRTWQARPIQS